MTHKDPNLMHIADAGHRERVFALTLVECSADAVGAHYNAKRDHIHLPDGQRIKVACEVTESYERLRRMGYDDQGIVAALERLRSVR